MDGDGTAAEDERPNNRQRAVSSSSSLPHLNADETASGGGGGSGGGNDSGVDVTPAVSCDSSLASGCYDPCKSPLGPFSPNETADTGPSSLPCYSMAAIGGSRPSTPTWRRPKFPNNMSSSFHFESTTGNRNSPPPSSSKKTDLNAAAKQSKISTVKKLVSTYDTVKSSSSSPLDRFACTLPRRRRKSKENLATSVVAGGSTAATAAAAAPAVVTPPKTPSLNRAASLRRKHIEQGALAAAAAAAAGAGATSPSSSPVNKPATAAVPPHRTGRPPAPVTVKTKIYHEVCSQTCLTGDDITSVLSGNLLPPVEHRIETNDADVQVSVAAVYMNTN